MRFAEVKRFDTDYLESVQLRRKLLEVVVKRFDTKCLELRYF